MAREAGVIALSKFMKKFLAEKAVMETENSGENAYCSQGEKLLQSTKKFFWDEVSEENSNSYKNPYHHNDDEDETENSKENSNISITIEQSDMDDALKKIFPSVSAEDEKKYLQLQKEMTQNNFSS